MLDYPGSLAGSKQMGDRGKHRLDYRHQVAKYLTLITEPAQSIAVPIEDLLKLYEFVRIQFVLDLL